MDSSLRQRFFHATARFKKTESFFSSECDMQMNELIILQSIAGLCECSDCESVNLDVPDIQGKLQITKPAISYILNTLEKKSYITREIDPKDRRKITIAATQEGKAMAVQSIKACDDMWDKVIDRFGEESMAQLLSLLRSLGDVFEDLDQER